jgi:chromosome partitioning protein
MKTIAFFNNKGGVGKTTLLYHSAWMFAEMGLRTVVVDFDPQSNLTSMCLDDDRLNELWDGPARGRTIVAAVAPLLEEGTSEVQIPHLEFIGANLSIVPGDLGLAKMEDELSSQWFDCLSGKSRAFRVTTAFHRLITLAADQFKADVVLIDVGPNLGALNRCGILAADHIVVPLVPDLFSLQGLRNLGPTLQDWRKGWTKRVDEAPASMRDSLPVGAMSPAGYVVLQHAVRKNRPVKAYERWASRIPAEYRTAMKLPADAGVRPEADNLCLAQLKHYRSLMPLAMEAGKPMFHLTPADGAIGSHVAAVADCHADFKRFALRLADSVGLTLPTPA